MRPYFLAGSLAPWLLGALAAAVLATFVRGPEEGMALAAVVTVVGLTRGLRQPPRKWRVEALPARGQELWWAPDWQEPLVLYQSKSLTDEPETSRGSARTPPR
jgi:hypothetical protein